MDATSRDHLPDYADSTRLPQWLLPNKVPWAPDRHLKYRLDILLVPPIKLAAAKSPDFHIIPAPNHTVYILEISLRNHATSDGRWSTRPIAPLRGQVAK
ncbi:hypothetical protein CHLRE_01g012244v5 [Chlamydomonas reinhardtii]|uniref:Uncharacterized protein n=1 Tax=Chlamydomonas reinhardtii TaxID=3055 RepID=A0A2K3E5L5_CHLRE|nr:uncharacterized protein CHLRE_01g012244v5 [Chlamydomonas reinhardtii]PNW88056.1 hypothetical protein CHLRE_01g012244v5 [Chlamydomonas reinhardtii]